MTARSTDVSRREFVRVSAAAAALAAAPGALASMARRSGEDTLRIGVIGCGGRGTGAAGNALAADPGVRIVAMADLFSDRLASSLDNLAGSADAERVDVPEHRRYVGFDAYQRLIDDAGCDSVILATPPHFRPIHLEAAIKAGKHVFMEKPVATDPAGIRRVIEAGRIAKARNLSIVSGTQRRHEDCYLAAMDRVHDGAIGEVVGAHVYWNQGGLWVHNRKPEYSDMEWQCRNWLYFCWLSGDHICEQHIHNIDVANWAIGAHPIRATGMGGRQVRTGSEYGNIFDHFAVEFEYPDGQVVTSMCRQIDNCASRVEEHIVGAKGRLIITSGRGRIVGAGEWKTPDNRRSPYVQEHIDLIASIRGDGAYLNEAQRVAESTLTAIMGRMSAYTGKLLTWDEALNSSLDLSPARYAFGELPMRPVSVPGRTPMV